ncbi:hypothetical protein RUM43_000929 [Polyplax serrata]|uniref:Uncharacterized protein n=1 Tax=Polyplax serrata TaxID=468196 RepID=A0AAN8SFF3_POLSC
MNKTSGRERQELSIEKLIHGCELTRVGKSRCKVVKIAFPISLATGTAGSGAGRFKNGDMRRTKENTVGAQEWRINSLIRGRQSISSLKGRREKQDGK